MSVKKVLPCNREHNEDGLTPWCIYKFDKRTGRKLRPQPKGWPKKFRKQEKAVRHLQTMKTFGGSVKAKAVAKVLREVAAELEDRKAKGEQKKCPAGQRWCSIRKKCVREGFYGM